MALHACGHLYDLFRLMHAATQNFLMLGEFTQQFKNDTTKFICVINNIVNLSVSIFGWCLALNDRIFIKENFRNLEDAEPLVYLIYTFQAMSHYQLEHWEESAYWAQNAIGRNPNFIVALRFLAATQWCYSNFEQTRATVQKMLDIDQSEHLDFYRKHLPYKNQTPIERLCEPLVQGKCAAQ